MEVSASVSDPLTSDREGLTLVLMGTGPFAVPSFEAVRQSIHHIVAVITKPPIVKRSRGGSPDTPVRDWANQHHLNVLDPENVNDPNWVKRLAEMKPDVLLVCDYGKILRSEVLDTAKLGGLNLHGSLLPRHRGAAPVQWAVLSGDQQTGVSVIHMTAKLDAGKVIESETTDITADETAGELEERLAVLGVQPTLRSLERLWQVGDQSAGVDGVEQDPAKITKAPRLSKADGAIDWNRTAEQIGWHVRGMQPWPVAWTLLHGSNVKQPTRLQIRRTSLGPRFDETDTIQPGSIRVDNDTFVVAAADRWVTIESLQPAGKKAMASSDFLRGKPLPENARMGPQDKPTA